MQLLSNNYRYWCNDIVSCTQPLQQGRASMARTKLKQLLLSAVLSCTWEHEESNHINSDKASEKHRKARFLHGKGKRSKTSAFWECNAVVGSSLPAHSQLQRRNSLRVLALIDAAWTQEFADIPIRIRREASASRKAYGTIGEASDIINSVHILAVLAHSPPHITTLLVSNKQCVRSWKLAADVHISTAPRHKALAEGFKKLIQKASWEFKLPSDLPGWLNLWQETWLQWPNICILLYIQQTDYYTYN